MNPIPYIPFRHIHPELKDEMMLAFEHFYDDQQYIMGEGLSRFEREFAEYNRVKYAIGVGNGHDALLIILKCLGIGSGDEVIVPAHTFIATVLSVVHAGAKPVLADIDEFSMNIDANEIDRKITKMTRAFVPVHLYGNPCAMDEIMSLAHSRSLTVVEDNAQAQGGSFNKQMTGSMGVINFTSFYPTKNIGALGDAGMITTNSSELAAKAKAMRNYGRSAAGDYQWIGVNSRMDELQARLLSVKLKYLDRWNAERIELAKMYTSRLKDIVEVRTQETSRQSKNVHHIFPILCEKKDDLRAYLLSKGIETLIHYEKPIHLHEAFLFLKYKKGDFPVAEKVCATELSLPIYPGLKEKEVFYICDQIKKFYRS